MKWIIQDWTGKRCWSFASFDSFEEGWDFIYVTDPEPDVNDPRWKTGWYDDYYVVEVK